jgi:hypothetical protein
MLLSLRLMDLPPFSAMKVMVEPAILTQSKVSIPRDARPIDLEPLDLELSSDVFKKI